jgi:hypothetical protein
MKSSYLSNIMFATASCSAAMCLAADKQWAGFGGGDTLVLLP